MLDKEDLIGMYRMMLLARRLDEKYIQMFEEGAGMLTPHSGIGHEAVGVGTFYKLPKTDIIQPHFRSPAANLSWGVTPRQIILQHLGKVGTGIMGRAHGLHYPGEIKGYLPSSAHSLGSGIPIAAGAALAAKLKRTNQVVVCVFGDGALGRGEWHETLNFAAIWKLPIVFVCENNEIAAQTLLSKSMATTNIADWAVSYGFPGIVVDGTDPVAVHEAVQEAVNRAREGRGPTLVECKCVRLRTHFEGCSDVRTKEKIEKLRERDPLTLFENSLKEKGILTKESSEKLNKEVLEKIEEAFRYAERNPYPELSSALVGVYAEAPEAREKSLTEYEKVRNITYREAIREAVYEEMKKDERVFSMGLGVVYGGDEYTGGATKGLASQFGEERVRDTPISESSMVGLGVGAATMGLRPIVEILHADFLPVAADQIINSAATIRYTTAGKVSCPLIIMTRFGVTGPGHAQSLDCMFANVPGIKIVMPSTPYDAKGLLKSAFREEDPIIYFSHKLLFKRRGPVPEEEYLVPIGKASIKREGNDVTVIATGMTVHKSLAAAEKLREEKVSVEVVDPRTLLPLDSETIIKSVKKTGRVVVVHEAPKLYGVGAEIVSTIVDEAFQYLDAPIKRLGGPFTPVPYTKTLIAHWLSSTSENAIASAVKEIVK